MCVQCDGQLLATGSYDGYARIWNTEGTFSSVDLGTDPYTQRCSLGCRGDAACNRLTNETVRRLSADNVTELLIAIRHS